MNRTTTSVLAVLGLVTSLGAQELAPATPSNRVPLSSEKALTPSVETLSGRAAKMVELWNGSSEPASAATTLGGSQAISGSQALSSAVTLSGRPVIWHPLELSFQGPFADERDNSPNPFTDYRLLVYLKAPSGKEFFVSGFFDGNGQGSGTGDVWKIRFTATEAGNWTYFASFRQAKGVALSKKLLAGSPASFNGAAGNFSIGALDPNAEGLLRWGMLEDVNGNNLKFNDGPVFLKNGVAGPENFLAYNGFDGTFDQAGGSNTPGLTNGLHAYGPHRSDWKTGDPLFVSSSTGVDSRGIIGALNYLADANVNSLSFLLLNLGGDGNDTSPYIPQGSGILGIDHFDISKLHQWNQVFEHAQRRGIVLQLFLHESDRQAPAFLDGGAFGVEHQLYYREMIARFGHLVGLQWNLSQKANQPALYLDAAASWLRLIDPYDHPLAIQTQPLSQSGNFGLYNLALGDKRFAAGSLFSFPDDAADHVELWRTRSNQNNSPWAVSIDGVQPTQTGLSDSNAEDLRKRMLWDVLFSGGGIEWSLGTHGPPTGGQLTLEDFRTREDMWEFSWSARSFIESVVPFWLMQPADQLVSGESGDFGGAEVFELPGEVYAVYYPKATNTGTLNLSGAPGNYLMGWYNPRTGAPEGSLKTVSGGGTLTVGSPPNTGGGGPAVIQAQNDIVVVEMESVPAVGGWQAQTSIAGYTGSSYYNWQGPDLFTSPGSGILSWDFYVPNGGTYQFRQRNYHTHPDPSEENDNWVRMDGGTWTKVYSGENNKWTWFSRFDPGHQDAFYNLSPGVHTLQISGRSHNFRVDRWHLYLNTVPNPLDETRSPSPVAPVGGGNSADEDWVLLLIKQ